MSPIVAHAFGVVFAACAVGALALVVYIVRDTLKTGWWDIAIGPLVVEAFAFLIAALAAAAFFVT